MPVPALGVQAIYRLQRDIFRLGRRDQTSGPGPLTEAVIPSGTTATPGVLVLTPGSSASLSEQLYALKFSIILNAAFLQRSRQF